MDPSGGRRWRSPSPAAPLPPAVSNRFLRLAGGSIGWPTSGRTRPWRILWGSVSKTPTTSSRTTYLQLRDGLVNTRRGGLEGHPIDEQVLEDRLDLFHHRRLEERPAEDRTEFRRLVVAQLHRRGLVSTGVEAVDNAAPAVMDDDGDAAAVGSRHLVAATDSWQIFDDEVETAVGLHALALLYNRQSSTMRLGRQRVPIDVPRIELTLSAQSATSSRSVARIHATSKASATTR
jgi:hypothetical protein